jgi:chromosome segregation ATPase
MESILTEEKIKKPYKTRKNSILTEEEQNQLKEILQAYENKEYSARQIDPTRVLCDVIRKKVKPTKKLIEKTFARLNELRGKGISYRKNSIKSILERHDSSIKTLNLKQASTDEKYELLNEQVRTLNKQVQDLSAEKETLTEENNVLKEEVEKLTI